MTQQTELAEVPYPPAPWRMRGECWGGLVKADRDVPCPAPWKPLLSSRMAMVVLMRYREGTLQYDELMVGPLVRHGLHVGLWIPHIWVTSEASLWGGRRMWRLPKEMATFSWEEGRVRVADASGPIATFGVGQRSGFWPPLPVPMPGVGGAPGGWTTFVGWMTARIAPGGLRVDEWSERFPFRLQGPASFSVRAQDMSITVPGPTVETAF